MYEVKAKQIPAAGTVWGSYIIMLEIDSYCQLVERSNGMNSIFAKSILSMILLFLIYSCSGRETREEFWGDGSNKARWTEIKRKDGKYYKDGKSTGWHKNGQKKFEAHYKDGSLHGKITEWDLNGTIRTERGYKDGEKHGKSIFMDDYGQIKFEAVYQNGELIEKIK